MGIQDKVMKIAMNNALESLNDNMPQMKMVLDNYKEWKHNDLLKIRDVINDIADMLEGANLPIKPDTIKVLGSVMLINADSDNEKYNKINKLITDIKTLLKD